MATNYDEKEIEEELEQIRSEFVSTTLTSQREVVKKMGQALEKVRKGEKARSGICEEIKNRLREEIERRLISEKTIENHCKPEWKNPIKSAARKGKSDENLRQESMLAVTASGTVETAAPSHDIMEKARPPVRRAVIEKRIELDDADEINQIVEKAEKKAGKKLPDDKVKECVENLIDFKRAEKSHREDVLVMVMTEPYRDEKAEQRRREWETMHDLDKGWNKLVLAASNLMLACDIHFYGHADNPEEISKRQKHYMEIFSHVGATGGFEEMFTKKFRSLERFAERAAIIRNEMAIIQPIIDAEIKNRRTIDNEKLR